MPPERLTRTAAGADALAVRISSSAYRLGCPLPPAWNIEEEIHSRTIPEPERVCQCAGEVRLSTSRKAGNGEYIRPVSLSSGERAGSSTVSGLRTGEAHGLTTRRRPDPSRGMGALQFASSRNRRILPGPTHRHLGEGLMAEVQSPLGTIELAATTFYVSDLDVAIAWYEETLGLQPTMAGADGDRYAAFSMGATFVVLEPSGAAMEPAAPGSESTTINLIVDREPAEVREELLARGVTCSEVLESPNYRSFLMRDVDGNRFYVSRPVTRDALRDVNAATASTAT